MQGHLPETPPRIHLGPVIQIGFVVRDAQAAAKTWTTLFDFDSMRIVDWPLRDDMRAELRGRPIDLKMRIAFVETGSVQLEFIQPLEPNNIFAEFLDRDGEGLHHILFDVDDPAETIAKIGAGVLQTGSTVRPGGQWYFLDTEKLLGFPLELRQKPPKEG
jgi:methylmalonyl-CoA/ethylmalonyl-CoA epimerase